MMAGAEWPPGINPIDTKAMTIRAISQNGDTSVAYIPVIIMQNMTVLHLSGPIQFQKDVLMSTSQEGNVVYGAVYDPLDDSRQIQVSLKVLGMINDTKIVPLPSWLAVKIPNSTLTLNANEPYYFMINPITRSAPVGTFTVAIGEHVGEQDYVENMPLHVSDVHFTGVASTTLPTASQPNLSTIGFGTGENSRMTLACFGGIVSSVAIVLSVYIIRKK